MKDMMRKKNMKKKRNTRFFTLAAMGLAAFGLVATPAVAQDDYDWYTDNDDFNDWVDEDLDDVEWERDAGYHEEEWWDPSDWFDMDTGVEYENDDWFSSDYDYDYDEDFESSDLDAYPIYRGYEADRDRDSRINRSDSVRDSRIDRSDRVNDQVDYGWHRDAAGSWDYGYHYDNLGDYDEFDYDSNFNGVSDRDSNRGARGDANYAWDRSLRGKVVGLKKIAGAADGQPDRIVLKLKTDNGQSRTVALGDLGYVTENMPKLRTGDEIVVGGRYVNVNGKRMLRADGMRSPNGDFDIPDYEWRRTIRGELVGMKQVRMRDGGTAALVAVIKDEQGDRANVLLGSTDDLERMGDAIRPGAQIHVNGYKRIMDNDESTFVVQDVRVLSHAQSRSWDDDRNRQERDQRQQASDRDNDDRSRSRR
ncbi:MAG: hypothetical protein ACF8PN_07675 [Phycisphaerales bacterium]